MMKVRMEQAADVLGFVAAHLALLQATGGSAGAGGVPYPSALAAVQPLPLHPPPHHRIGRHPPQLRLLLGQHLQVVVVQLVAPAGVLPVLLAEHHALRRRHARMPARIAAYLIAQRPHRTRRQAGTVVPAFDRRHSQGDRLLAQRVLVLRAASSCSACCSSPRAGGAANSGPITENRNRAC